MPTERAQSLRGIADEAGLSRWEVTTLVTEHGIRTYPLGGAFVVVAEDRPKLARVLAGYKRAKALRVRSLEAPRRLT